MASPDVLAEETAPFLHDRNHYDPEEEPTVSAHPPSAHPPLPTPRSITQDTVLENIFVCAIMGNFLEWYEAALFGVFAVELGTSFFPRLTPDGDFLLLSFSVFAFAFSVRPVGGFLFTKLGQRFGKLFAVRLSMFMMALTTSMTAFIPNYSQIGYLAPMLFVTLRGIQGMSIGGETSAMMVYMLDVIPRERRGFFGACLNVSASGALLSAVIGGVLRLAFPESMIDAWAWRIPFAGGAVVAIIIMVFINQNLQVSVELVEQSRRELQARSAVTSPGNPCCENFPIVVSCCAVFALSSGGYWFLFVFIPTYLRHHVLDGPAIPIPCMSNSIALILFLAFSLLGGYFADRERPAKLMTTAAICLGGFAPCALYVLSSTTNVTQASFLQSLLSSLLGFYVGSSISWLVERLPSNANKYETWGLASNLAAAIFGGTMPLCAGLCVEHLEKPIGPTSAGALLSFLALLATSSVLFNERCCGDNSTPARSVMVDTTHAEGAKKLED